MFLISFMTFKYPLILEIHLKFFKKLCKSLIKKVKKIQFI